MSELKKDLRNIKNLPEIVSDSKSLIELCSVLWVDKLKGTPLVITLYQAFIIQAIFFKCPRMLCIAPTRAGKSLAVALGALLLGAYKSGEKIRIVSFTEKTTKIIMGYVIDYALDNELLYNNLMYDVKNLGIDRIKKEFSKSRIVYAHNSEIMTLTANIGGGGSSLVGWGATTLIVDEAEQMPEELVDTKIMRMLGDTPDASVFMISNPEHRGFMYRKRNHPDWDLLVVSDQDCIDAGRFTQAYINERKESLTSRHYQIWYKPWWPDEDDDALFSSKAMTNMFSDITPAEKKQLKGDPDAKHLGVDVARMGVDLTVFIETLYYGDKKYITDIYSFEKKRTTYSTGAIIRLNRDRLYDSINVDDPGLGSGVVDPLYEHEETSAILVPFLPGKVDSDWSDLDKKLYLNNKAKCASNWSKDAENGLVRVVTDKYRAELYSELECAKVDYMSSGKIKIVKPDGKSPDYFDAMNISMYAGFKLSFDFI